MAQGKAWKKEEIVELLKPKFQKGYSIEKACQVIGFPSSTFKTWLEGNDELRLKINAWQKEIDELARDIVIEEMQNKDSKGRLGVAIDWLEKREKDEFSTRTETDITSKGDKITKYEIEIVDANTSHQSTSKDLGESK